MFHEWAVTYAGRETEDEQSLVQMMGALPEKFYVIGAPNDSSTTIDHELSHAFFHLFPDYRIIMLSMFRGYDVTGVRKYLKSNMYAPDVFLDESIAYIMFDDALLHAAGVSTKHLRCLRGGMLGVYKAYKDRLIKL